MSQKNTTSDTSVKVVSDAREDEILSIFRTLHGKVLLALQECEVKPLFPDNFAQCAATDYKVLHQQARALLIAKGKDRTDKRVAEIRGKVAEVIDTHMSQARAAKAALEALPADVRKFLPSFSSVVKVPLSDIRACFPTNASDKEVFEDLTYMGYKVTDLTDKGQVIVPFVPAPTTTDTEEVKAA